MIKRWFKNLRWLFNHPPTNITQTTDERLACDYCQNPKDNSVKVFPMSEGPEVFSYCYLCLRKAMNKVLKPELLNETKPN